MRSFLHLAVITLMLVVACTARAAPPPDLLIGYSELRTDQSGGRHANIKTMRAAVVRADGTRHRLVSEDLAAEANSWTQFAGWAPDGKSMIIGRGWESPANAAWEEEHKTFRFAAEGWLHDDYVVDIETGKGVNLTSVDRVSFYNTGLFFWPGDPARLGFQALINGESRPFSMDRDGRNKRDLSGGGKGFAYGFQASPDGKRVAYHKDYQVFLADADGTNARRMETGNPFNFCPTWSADGSELLFLSGELYNCHPHLVRGDGTGLRKLADRGGYRGVVEFLDVPDFHGGSSDLPIWSPDGIAVFYTARVGTSVELHRVNRDGKSDRLTNTAAGTLHYHPTPSPDGRWLVYGTFRAGVRQLFIMDLSDKSERPLTTLVKGRAAMWPHWQPAPR